MILVARRDERLIELAQELQREHPKLLVHKVWVPPFGGGTHNALPQNGGGHGFPAADQT